MEKYNALSKITEEYLHGTLIRLVMEYENKSDLHISMQYKDDTETWYDYEMLIHKNNHKIDFIKHDAHPFIDCVHLSRITEFEDAFAEYLFTT